MKANYYAIESHGKIGVKDKSGGVWWPNSETQAQIQASRDPKALAKKICEREPMRGTWHN